MIIKNLTAVIVLTLITVNTLAQDKRIIENYNLEIIQDVLLSENEIFTPSLLNLTEDKNVVFFDFKRYELIVYNIGDKAFKLYGNRGRGPKEFGRIFDIKTDKNGEIYLIDTGNNKILKWDVNGNFIGEIAIGSGSISPARFAICKESDLMYILSSQFNEEGIIHQYTKQGTLKKSFNKTEVSDARLVYYTDGFLACDGNENIYYAPRYINEIKKYDRNGKLVYNMLVFDSEPNDEIVKENGRFIGLNPSATRFNGNIYYLNDKLYVGYSGRAKNFFRLIDVYSESHQEYLHSIQLPFEFKAFAINEKGVIVALREDEDGEMYLTVFKYKYND